MMTAPPAEPGPLPPVATDSDRKTPDGPAGPAFIVSGQMQRGRAAQTLRTGGSGLAALPRQPPIPQKEGDPRPVAPTLSYPLVSTCCS